MSAFRIGAPPPRVRARPNRHGTRLVCGNGDCGEELIPYRFLSRAEVARIEALAAENGLPVACFAPRNEEAVTGYSSYRYGARDGVDRPAAHARTRYRHDVWLASGGGGYAATHLKEEAKLRLRERRTIGTARPFVARGAGPRATFHPSFPGGKMECIKCGRVNEISRDLSAEAFARQRRKRGVTPGDVLAAQRRLESDRERFDRAAAGLTWMPSSPDGVLADSFPPRTLTDLYAFEGTIVEALQRPYDAPEDIAAMTTANGRHPTMDDYRQVQRLIEDAYVVEAMRTLAGRPETALFTGA